MKRKCQEMGVPLKRLSPDAMEKLLYYGWPGNVRELENELERLIVLTGSSSIVPSDMLDLRILNPTGRKEVAPLATKRKLKDVVEEIERRMIQEGLVRCSFNKSRLARETGHQ